MKFYFSKIQEPNEFEGLFEDNGNFYFYQVDIDNDGITISDSLGRSIPIDKSEVRDLSKAFFIAEKAFEDQAEVSALVSKRTDELEQLIQFLATND